MWLSFDKETVDALKQLLARKDLVCELPVEVSGQLTDALEMIEQAEVAYNSVSRAAFRESAEEFVKGKDIVIDADAVVNVDEDDTAEAFVMAWVRVNREDEDEDDIDEAEEDDEEDEDEEVVRDEEAELNSW